MKTYRDKQVWEDAIDANSGASVGATNAISTKDLTQDDRSNLIALNDVKQEIVDAVVVSEKVAHGNAISGGLMKENGRLNFVIVVLSDDEQKQVRLEPPHSEGRKSRRPPQR